MSESNENKGSRMDMISQLQMKQSQNVEKKKEEELNDDGWSDFSEEDYNESAKDQTKSSEVSGRIPIKTENKSKKFNNLKDYLGDPVQSNKFNQKDRKKHQGGNFYHEGNKKEKGELSRPVFTPTQSNFNEDAFNSIRNNNSEYTKKNFSNNTNYSNKDNYNGNSNFRDNYKDNNNFKNNNYDQRPQFNNPNKTYQKPNPITPTTPITPVDEKEIVMKSIHNFGSLVKNLNEENKNIKAPLKSYLDCDLSKDNVVSSNITRDHNRENRDHNRDNNQRKERTHYENKNSGHNNNFNNENKNNKEEIQRPTFTNSQLETKPSNFKELDVKGDLYLQKLQHTNMDNLVEYSNKDSGAREKKQKKGFNQKENVEEDFSKNFDNLNINENHQTFEDEPQHPNLNHDNAYKKGKKKNFNKNKYDNEDDVWDMVTGEHRQEDVFENYENEYYVKNDYQKNEYYVKNDYQKNEYYVKNDYQKNDYSNDFRPAQKQKKIITKPVEPEKKVEEKSTKDKVVVKLQNAKSIKDIFG